jgi:hypothetical protein
MIHAHVTKISGGILNHFLANIQSLIEKEHYTSSGILNYFSCGLYSHTP